MTASPHRGRGLPLLLVAFGLLVIGALLASLSSPRSDLSYLSRLLLLAGSATALWSLVRGWRTLLFVLGRLRAMAEPGPGLAWFLIGLLLVVISLGLARRPLRMDLTLRGLHSLSRVSLEALDRMPGRVELVGIYPEGTPEHARARGLLDMYGTGSSRISTRMIDPQRQPGEMRRLGIDLTSGLLVRADSVRESVMSLDEASVTQAILRVQDRDRPFVGVLDGHGELAPDRAKVTEFYRMLLEGGMRRRMLRLAEEGEVPPEVRAVFVFGPSTALFPGEIAALNRFLDRGGRLGLFLDPPSASGLRETLAERGILYDGRPLRDPGALTSSAGLGPETIVAHSLGEHDITHRLTRRSVLAGVTRVSLAPRPVWGTTGGDLLRTAPSAELIGEPPDSGGAAGSRPGVWSMGVALEWAPPSSAGSPAAAAPAGSLPERGVARLVVIGDSDFIRDEQIDLYGNREFAARIVGWLCEKEYLLDFPPLDTSGTPLRVSLRGLRVVFYLVEVLLPLGALAAGVVVWLRRR